MSVFRALPWPLQLAACALVAAIGIVLLVLAFQRGGSGSTTDQRARHRAKAERADLRASKTPHDARMDVHVADADTHVGGMSVQSAADKPPYQPGIPSQPATSPVASPRKLPGQDRLTRDRRTGMDVDRTGQAVQNELSSPPLAAAEPPRLRRTDPTLAPGAPAPAPPTTEFRAVQPPVPAPFPPPPANETRAQRRVRLEETAQRALAADRRPDSGDTTWIPRADD